MFFERFKKICIENGTNPTKFSTEVLNMSRSNVTRWKKGTNPNSDVVAKIASYFNVSTDYLLGKTNKSNISDITFDDFTYAMYNETKDLTSEDKVALLDIAKIFKKRLEERRK